MYTSSSNSRLTRKIEKKSKRIITLTIIGIILVLYLLFKFGIPLLVGFSLFIAGRGSPDNSQDSNNQTFISAPILDPLFTATNSAQIKVTGSANPNETIELFVNNNKTDAVDTKSDGSFRFDNVSLKDGNNSIKARAKVKDKTSDFSQTQTISFVNKAPKLDVSNPHDGDKLSKDDNSVVVSGQTDQAARVTVNGFWAIVDDNGNFTYTMQLQNGDNQIKVVAIDTAGNQTEKDLKVNYSQ